MKTSFFTLTLNEQKKIVKKKYILEKIPDNIKIDIGLEDDNEKLFLYFPDNRKLEDKKLSKSINTETKYKVWLIALIKNEYYIVDASDKIGSWYGFN